MTDKSKGRYIIEKCTGPYTDAELLQMTKDSQISLSTMLIHQSKTAGEIVTRTSNMWYVPEENTFKWRSHRLSQVSRRGGDVRITGVVLEETKLLSWTFSIAS